MVQIIVDTKEIARVISNMGRVNQWLPPTIDKEMRLLGGKVVPIMKSVLRPRRYTGTLEDSVNWSYDLALRQLSIGPYAKRGNYDAGMIAQTGTRPIKNVPWKPLFAWASKRSNTPRALASHARKVIALHGVKKAPFLMETMNQASFQMALEDTANRLGVSIAAQAIAGKDIIGVAVTQ